MSQSFNPKSSTQAEGLDRRLFLKLAAMFSLSAAGCGGSGDSTGGFSGTSAPPPSNPPVPFTGRVNLQDFGGGPLFLQSALQKNVVINADGTFTTLVTGNQAPQLFFLTGQPPASRAEINGRIDDFFPGPLKALGLFFPGASLAFELSLNSTAIALVFLTYGILTVDLAEAAQRIARIVQLSSYSSLVGGLSGFLQTSSLAEAGPDPAFQALKQACVDEFFLNDVQARLDAQEIAQLLPQGLLRSRKGGVDDQQKQTIAFENHGFRWVSVIRQELNAAGSSTKPPKKAPLFGANVGGIDTLFKNTDGLLGGGNTLGWGNLFTDQFLEPGLGTDIFRPDPATTRVRYWIMGPGQGDVAGQLPPDIALTDFGPLQYHLTAFYFFFLPFFDLVSGGLAGTAVHRLGSRLLGNSPEALESIENLEAIAELGVGSSGLVFAGDGLVASLRTGDEGNITSGWIDVLAALTSLSVTVGQQALIAFIDEALVASAAAVGTEGFAGLIATVVTAEAILAALTALAAVFAVGGLAFALTNFSRAILDHKRLPALVQLTEILRPSLYDLVLFPAGQRGIVGDNFSDNSEVILHLFEQSEVFIWRPLLGGVVDPNRELVGPLPPSRSNWQHQAHINSNGYLAYLAHRTEEGRHFTMLRRGPSGDFVELNDGRVSDDFHYPIPLGLNNENLLVGIRARHHDVPRGQLFLYDLSPGGALTLIDLASKLSIPDAVVLSADVNDLGQVVGIVANPFEQTQGIFVYLPDGTARILVPIDQLSVTEVTINNLGQVLYKAADLSLRILDLDGQLVRQLAIPPGFTDAHIIGGALNDAGQVVGQVSGFHKFTSVLWDADGTPRDLADSIPSLISEGEPVPQFGANRINNAGVILLVGFGGTALLVPKNNS